MDSWPPKGAGGSINHLQEVPLLFVWRSAIRNYSYIKRRFCEAVSLAIKGNAVIGSRPQEERSTKRLSISVVVAPVADVDSVSLLTSSLESQTRKPDEVILVHTSECPAMCCFCQKRHIKYTFRGNDKSFNLRANIGIAFATKQVVFIFKGGETFGDTFLSDIHSVMSGQDIGVVLCESRMHSPYGDVLAARRDSFVYGPLDERFEDSTLSLRHWLEYTFKGARRRVAHFDKYLLVKSSDLEWVNPQYHNVLRGIFLCGRALGRAKILSVATLRQAGLADLRFLLAHTLGRLVRFWFPNPYSEDTPYRDRDFWERNTCDYVRWEIFQPDEEEIREAFRITSPQTVLELGCGSGRNFKYLPRGARYFGLDLAMNLIRRAKHKVQENIRGIVCGDAVQLCFKHNQFDVVFAVSTIQHIPPERVAFCVEEIVRVARRYIFIIEHTQEEDDTSNFFSQKHLFRHDYQDLFGRYTNLIARKETSYRVQPAVKELFVFEKRS